VQVGQVSDLAVENFHPAWQSVNLTRFSRQAGLLGHFATR
jgi:hypothetical protein